MATTTLHLNRRVETINIQNEYGEAVLSWQIPTDDKHLEIMLKAVGDAMSRFSAVWSKIEKAADKGEEDEAKSAMVHLLKRTVTAILGQDAWSEILDYMGDGVEIDPADYIMDLGEIFAALCTWLYERCTSQQLRDAGIFFRQEQANMNRQGFKPRRPRKKNKK